MDPAPASGIITDRVSFFLPLAAERSTTTQAWSPFRMATTGSSNLEMFFKGRRTTRPTNPARAAARAAVLRAGLPLAEGHITPSLFVRRAAFLGPARYG